jgi:hypothetical protein
LSRFGKHKIVGIGAIALIFAMLTILAPASSISQGNTPVLDLFAGASFDMFGDRLAGQDCLGLDMSIAFAMTDNVKAGIWGHFAEPTFHYDLIGTQAAQTSNLSVYSCFLELRILRLGQAFSLSSNTSLGVMFLSTKEQQISVGGFGSIRIPSRREQTAISSFGFVLSTGVLSPLTISVSPRLVFVSPMQISSVGYSVQGGMSIGVL